MSDNNFTATKRVRELIRWVDSRSDDCWCSVAEVEKTPAIIESVGWVVFEDDEVVCLAGSIATNLDACACTMIIPKACVKKREVL